MIDSATKLLVRIKDLAINGRNYTKDPYDKERYDEILSLSSQLLSDYSDIPKEQLLDDFLAIKGYSTPKIGTRAAIFIDGKILLVRETLDGKWAMPGGWVDNTETIYSNVIKESVEEAGVHVVPQKIVGIFSGIPVSQGATPIQSIVKVFVICLPTSPIHFHANTEIAEYGLFSADDLPPLSELRNTVEQVNMCFIANESNDWQAFFE